MPSWETFSKFSHSSSTKCRVPHWLTKQHDMITKSCTTQKIFKKCIGNKIKDGRKDIKRTMKADTTKWMKNELINSRRRIKKKLCTCFLVDWLKEQKYLALLSSWYANNLYYTKPTDSLMTNLWKYYKSVKL